MKNLWLILFLLVSVVFYVYVFLRTAGLTERRSEAFKNRTWLSFGFGGWIFLFWLSDKAQNSYIQTSLFYGAVLIAIFGAACFFEARFGKEDERGVTDPPFGIF